MIITDATVIHGRLLEASKVRATFEDGSERVIIRFYPDELHFAAHEVIGLTFEQAQELHRRKDRAYLGQ